MTTNTIQDDSQDLAITPQLARTVEELSATLDIHSNRIANLEHWRGLDKFLRVEDVPEYLDSLQYGAHEHPEVSQDIGTLFLTIEGLFERVEYLEMGWWQRFIDGLCHRWHNWRGGGARD